MTTTLRHIDRAERDNHQPETPWEGGSTHIVESFLLIDDDSGAILGPIDLFRDCDDMSWLVGRRPFWTLAEAVAWVRHPAESVTALPPVHLTPVPVDRVTAPDGVDVAEVLAVHDATDHLGDVAIVTGYDGVSYWAAGSRVLRVTLAEAIADVRAGCPDPQEDPCCDCERWCRQCTPGLIEGADIIDVTGAES